MPERNARYREWRRVYMTIWRDIQRQKKLDAARAGRIARQKRYRLRRRMRALGVDYKL